jgi:hypothetical protein
MDISCIDDVSCQYLPLAIIPEVGVSEISIMRSEGLVNENVLYVQKISPPWIFEIKYKDPRKPSIQRIYTLGSDDDDYISLTLLDANQDYLIAHMFSSVDMKPVLRVYKRTNSFLSIGHEEVQYTDFIDEGTFFQFLSVRDNYFVIKTSDYFTVMKLMPT